MLECVYQQISNKATVSATTREMAGAVATEEVYELPAIAVRCVQAPVWQLLHDPSVLLLPCQLALRRTLSDEGLQLELHSLGFSHYCMRARWALILVGLPYKEVHYLPLSHVVGIKRLQVSAGISSFRC